MPTVERRFELRASHWPSVCSGDLVSWVHWFGEESVSDAVWAKMATRFARDAEALVARLWTGWQEWVWFVEENCHLDEGT
jgi:hypothetical protein